MDKVLVFLDTFSVLELFNFLFDLELILISYFRWATILYRFHTNSQFTKVFF